MKSRTHTRAAEHGHGLAQWVLGCRFENGESAPQDHAEAIKWYRKAAKQSCSAAIDGLKGLEGQK